MHNLICGLSLQIESNCGQHQMLLPLQGLRCFVHIISPFLAPSVPVCTSVLWIKTLASLYFMSPCCCFASVYFTFVQRCPSNLLSACTALHKSTSKLLSACGCCGLPLPVSSALSLVAIQTTSSTKKDFWKLHTEITFEVCGGTLTSCSSIKMIDSA